MSVLIVCNKIDREQVINHTLYERRERKWHRSRGREGEEEREQEKEGERGEIDREGVGVVIQIKYTSCILSTSSSSICTLKIYLIL